MAGAQVRRRDGVSAAGAGRARNGDHYRPGRAVRAMPAAAGGARGPGRDLRIFVGRARKTVETARTAQRLRAGPASDRRQSPSARVVGRIEKTLARGLWVLETIVTGAPLLGLLGTITGMMQSFNVIGSSTLVAPTQVTAGVAQALIATALGLLIAVLSLFAFNLFSRMQSHSLDTMERLGSRLVDHIRLDQEGGEAEPTARPAAVAR